MNEIPKKRNVEFGNKVRREYISRVEKFVEEWLSKGRPLPKTSKGTLSIAAIAGAAGLSRSITNKMKPAIISVLDEYVKEATFCKSRDFYKLYSEIQREDENPNLNKVLIIFNELLESTLDTVDSDESKSVYKSAFLRYLKVIDREIEDLVEDSFTINYEDNIKNLRSEIYQNDHRKAASTIAALQKFRLQFLKMLKTADLPIDLSGSIRILVEKDDRSINKINTLLEESDGYLYLLIRGRVKSSSVEKLVRLEKILDVPRGTLTGRSVYYNPRNRRNFCPIKFFPEEFQGKDNRAAHYRREIRLLLPDGFPSLPIKEQEYLFSTITSGYVDKGHLSDYGRRLGECIRKT